MKRPAFTVRDLFWLVLVAGLALAWGIDRTRHLETFYLHIYSREVDTGFDLYHPHVNSTPPKLGEPVRIASIAITDNRRFSAEMPNNYVPTVRLKGKLTRHSTRLKGVLTVGIESPQTAFEYEHSSPIIIEEPTTFFGDYRFVVSRSEDAYDERFVQKLMNSK